MVFGTLLAALLLVGESRLSDDEMGELLTYYYLDPNPVAAIDSLEPLNELWRRTRGISLAELSERGGVRSFYAEVLKSSPEAVKIVESRLPNLSVDLQVFVKEALRRCDSTACERARGTPFIATEDPLSVSALDDYWGAFNASGAKQPVVAVIEALPLVEVRGDVDQLLIGGAAKWSLTSNAFQHSRVLEYCREYLKDAGDPIKEILTEVISDAEAELAKEQSPEPQRSED